MSDSDGRPADDPGAGDGSEDESWQVDPDDGGQSDGDGDAPATPEEDGGWRFGLDDVDEDGIARRSIEPGEIDPENALFVVLGAIAMVVVAYQLYTLLT